MPSRSTSEVFFRPEPYLCQQVTISAENRSLATFAPTSQRISDVPLQAWLARVSMLMERRSY
jgi:hypothetical protein